MKRIKEIKIKNFKAFQEEETFAINGKNILVYGNNGAGKSSLFWALYTILQSSTKSNVDIQKYFKEFDEGNPTTHQSLKNVFLPPEEESYIKFTSIDAAAVETIHTISHDTINTNLDTDTAIQELNLASDFINYKLLHNFYRGSHKQEVNLWPVFERDIFPVLTKDTKNWLKDIIKTDTQDVPKTNGRVVSRGPKERYETKLSELNTKIDSLLQEIENNANVFIKEHFYQGDDVIKLKLTFEKKFHFDLVKNQIWKEGWSSYRHDNLKIKLAVEIKEGEGWKPISRVQSFLNEAQLTRIAISIRIGALRTRVQGTDFKILVLDDMLISLDMSNRMDIVRIILNKENKESLKYFDSFQKIILTHDKAFFNLIRRNTDDEDWKYYKFLKDESKNEAPTIKEDPSELQKAQKELSEGEFEAVGNRLRRVVEDLLVQFDDPEMKKLDKEFEGLSKKLEKALNKIISRSHQQFKQKFISDLEIEKLKKIKEDYNADGTLDQADKDKITATKEKVFDYLIELNETNDRKEKLIKNTKEILDRIMNPASHGGGNPLYRAELVDAIESIKELKNYLNE